MSVGELLKQVSSWWVSKMEFIRVQCCLIPIEQWDGYGKWFSFLPMLIGELVPTDVLVSLTCLLTEAYLYFQVHVGLVVIRASYLHVESVEAFQC